ncbi:MAG: class I SAM-dependent methyltransferase [Undibacterium sp.]|nr:class I SAM-dependent methyltransferase [Undibacterium sp.]
MKSTLFSMASAVWKLCPDALRQAPFTRDLAHQIREQLQQKSSVTSLSQGPVADNLKADELICPHTEATVEGDSIKVAIIERNSTAEKNSTAEQNSTNGATITSGPRVLRTLAELDEMLTMLDQAATISDDELRRGFTQFQMQFPLDLPPDPDSAEYRAKQMELYQWLNGKPYSITHEVCPIDVKEAIARPFPFSSKSPYTVGNHIISIGHVIRTLNLKEHSSILEFGPGWGNTTIWLARMGYDVTAVDIEQNFIDLINARAQANGLHVDAILGDFSLIHQFEKRFDAVLFFECFHHCSEHQALIAGLDKVVAPGGKVLFAAEPILDEFPIPWGLRLDGESLWAIRHQGWLELGFQESYFRGLLLRHGWKVDKQVCSETPWGTIFVATRLSEQV